MQGEDDNDEEQDGRPEEEVELGRDFLVLAHVACGFSRNALERT